MVFDLICYALATVTVLAFVGSNKRSQQRVERTVSAAKEAIATVNALDLELPEDCFSVDAIAVEIPAPAPVQPVASAVFDCGNVATAEEWAIVETAQEAIALHWVCDNLVPFACPVKQVAPKSVTYRNRDELRAHCWSILGTAYDSVNGKRKFWTVARMVEELSLAGWEVSKAA